MSGISTTVGHVLLTLCMFFNFVDSFNIATEKVTIISGTRDSYFGYTVDFAEFTDQQGKNYKWVLIGAPKGQGTSGNRTGVVYKRPLTNNFVAPQEIDLVKGADGKIPTEDTSHMWLGAAMAVGDNSITVCAPRWKNKVNNSLTFMNGLCYAIQSGFLYLDQGFLKPQVRPLLTVYPDQQLISPDPARHNMIWEYGVAAAGMSVAYDKSDQAGATIYGAPGVNEFAGAALFKGPNKNVVAHSQEVTAAYESQMYGYAIATGKFYDDSLYYIALGGPRDSGTGKVLILDKDFRRKQQLSGKEPGSYFGASLCAVKRREGAEGAALLVGAPMYSGLTSYSGYYDNKMEQGAVYVYVKDAQNKLLMIQMLMGSKEPHSRFGTAMASLEDINKDTYHDIVVGAPFGMDGKGEIFIYNGYNRGFMETQRIVGADLDTRLSNTFGCSFSQNALDVNGDSYKDVVVGSYGTDTATILYTKPPIAMEVTTKISHQIIQKTTQNFTVAACFKYSGRNLPSNVAVDYSITADTLFMEDSKRVCILERPGGNCVKEVIQKNQDIFKDSPEPRCLQDFTVVVRDKKVIRDLFVPVVFTVRYNISDSTTCTGTICPVINRFDARRNDPMSEVTLQEVNFAKPGCMADNICQTDLDLEVSQPKFNYMSSDTLILGPDSGFSIDIEFSVTGEPAYYTKLKVSSPQDLSYIRTTQVSTDVELRCSVISPDRNAEIECDTTPSQLGLTAGKRGKITMFFAANQIKADVATVNVQVEVTTLSRDTNTGNNVRSLSFPAETRVTGRFEVLSTPEVYVTKKDAVDRKFAEMRHSITFFNSGPSDIEGFTTFTMAFPSGRIGNKWVIVAEKATLNVSMARPNTKVTCDTEVKEVDSKVKPYKDYNIKTMNATKEPDMDAQYDCRIPGSCNKITCRVMPIPASSHVRVRIFSKFDPQLYSRASGQEPNPKFIPLVTSLKLQLPSNVKSEVKNENNFATTEIYPTVQQIDAIPGYIILLAVIAGIVAILIVVGILFKCGFFKRKAREELTKLKDEEQHTLVKEGGEANQSNTHTMIEEKEGEGDDDDVELIKSNGTNEGYSIADAPNKEDWGEVDDMLGGLEDGKGEVTPEDVKIETEADIVNENKEET